MVRVVGEEGQPRILINHFRLAPLLGLAHHLLKASRLRNDVCEFNRSCPGVLLRIVGRIFPVELVEFDGLTVGW